MRFFTWDFVCISLDIALDMALDMAVDTVVGVAGVSEEAGQLSDGSRY